MKKKQTAAPSAKEGEPKRRVTLARSVSVEMEERKSVFIGHAAPVASEEEADLLNLLLDPQDFENWPVRHLRMNTRGYSWTEGWDPEQADAGSVYPWLTGRACDRDDFVMGEELPYDGEEDVESGGIWLL